MKYINEWLDYGDLTEFERDIFEDRLNFLNKLKQESEN